MLPRARRLIYRLGPARYRDRALIAWATAVAGGTTMDPQVTEAWIAVLKSAAEGPCRDFRSKGATP